jgi:hypothetical protein
MTRESPFAVWRERWLRRGELFAVAAFTSAVATAANGKWVAAAVSLGALAVGVYAICAVEADWWLPGRKNAKEKTAREGAYALLPQGGGTTPDATAVVSELQRLNGLLEWLPERLVIAQNPDEEEEVLERARARRFRH